MHPDPTPATNGAPSPTPPTQVVSSGVLEERVAGVRVAMSASLGAHPVPTSLPAFPSMRDFLTDGSVPSLCDELARLTGVPIWMRDRNGDVIIPVDSTGREDASRPWRIVDEATGAARAASLVGRTYEPRADLFMVTLRISTGILGAIVTPLEYVDPTNSDEPPATGAPRSAGESLRRALTLLGSSVSEVCEAQVSVWQRVHELEALFRLSSLLAQAGAVDDLLNAALNLAVDVLHADAGTIAVIESEQEDFAIKASRGVSKEWVAHTRALTSGGVLRQAALTGQVVTVEDMRSDERIAVRDLAKSEGLCSLLSTGLLYHGRPIGLIRLYTRRRRAFTLAEQTLLKSIADQAAAAITNARLRALREEDQRIQRQVKLAADVQRRMIPRTMPDNDFLDIAARYAPSFELGGDFYDFIELGRSMGIVVGDVVGKGVAAALLMAAVRASLRAHAQDVYDIGEVLARVNAALVRDTRDNEFTTLWYGVVEPKSLRLTYCGAGHEWPILIRVPQGRAIADEDLTRLTADGMALGIDAQQRYVPGVFDLKPGDIIVAYTDGLTDATNFESKRFGGTRVRRSLVDLLTREPDAPAARIVEQVFWDLRQFTGLSKRVDDVTLVVAKVRAR
jgi:sigma-B regulation protein RsbU (phosphoserine phosphatase)